MRKTTAAATSHSSRPRAPRRDGNGHNSIRERKRAHAFGRATEARFVLDAQRRGFAVSRPFVSSPGYDCIVDREGRLLRVQVKGLHQKRGPRGGLYGTSILSTRPSSRRFDVLALWLEAEGVWLFLPRAKLPLNGVHVTGRSRCRTGIEDWEIFGRPLPRRPVSAPRSKPAPAASRG